MLQLLESLDNSIATEGQHIAAFKACLKEHYETLGRRFHAGEAVESLVHERAEMVDEIMRRAWAIHIPDSSETALVAVGGYGRGELHPASDVDVLILNEHDPADLEGPLSEFIMFLWDIGLEIGHSVRSVEDCVFQAESDITIATNLMESRYLTGQEALFDDMQQRTGPDRIWPSKRFFEAKCEEQKARHRKYDDSAYNLEPNLKENPGGLRDIQIIGWVAKRHLGADSMHDLVDKGFLTDAEHLSLMSGQSLLWKIRFALHLITGRHDDRLLFEHQRQIARDFGYQDAPDKANLAVESFMQEYYRVVMELNRLNEMLLQHYQEAILFDNELQVPVVINARFQARNGYLELRNDGTFARYPLAMLELFLILQQNPDLVGVRASTIRSVRAHLHLIDDRLRNDIRAKSLFMEILRQPSGITHELRRMHHYGVLESYLPVFGKIVGLMQFDLFHVYTVDEHTLMVVRNLRRITVEDFQHEFPLASQIAESLPKPELLYIAGLFHDIAKGRGGDHAKLGAVDAHAFCRHHQLSHYDASLVAWLVESHLLMSVTAQRRDIDDPAVVQEFAAHVGDQIRLDYLYLLTGADIRGTNPKRWNSWKDSLLNKLYSSTSQALLRGLDNFPGQDALIQEKQTEARQQLVRKGFTEQQVNELWLTFNLEYFLHTTPLAMVWQAEVILNHSNNDELLVTIRESRRRGCNEILLYGPDQPGLFAYLTALLDKLHLNILEARLQTTSTGMILNTFFVLENSGEIISGSTRIADIITQLSMLDTARELIVNTRPTSRQIRQFNTCSEVEFKEDSTSNMTVLALNALDSPGLLHRVSKVFFDQDIRIHKAKITTLGARAEDRFWISDAEDKPLSKALKSELSTRIIGELDQ
ncbi:MAG: [protein-PII] uridylyltransferase [bacterium]